ncbi:hypothetical protein DFH09DRAFT_1355549 [Mycena vulgaris]|nr:hypothetical protein DFH09DRAFT_1355549 [Mycena vulgaris]
MSNVRQKAISKAVVSTIQEPSYKVLLPWLLQRTWDGMLSPIAELREGYKIVGRMALNYAFMLAFRDVCDEFEAGCSVGLFATLQDCLLSEQVLFEIMKKPSHAGVKRIADTGVGAVADGVYLFIGGLWQETLDFGKVTPLVKTLFIPLIRVGMETYTTFRLQKKPRVAEVGAKIPVELRVLYRIYKLQVAKKTFKIPQAELDSRRAKIATMASLFPPTPPLLSPSPFAQLTSSLPTNNPIDLRALSDIRSPDCGLGQSTVLRESMTATQGGKPMKNPIPPLAQVGMPRTPLSPWNLNVSPSELPPPTQNDALPVSFSTPTAWFEAYTTNSEALPHILKSLLSPQ